MKSKYAKVVLATCVASSISAAVSAASFKDTNIPWAKASIDALVESGAIKGYPDGTFQPNKQISRAEVATIMNKLLNKYDENATVSFSDVKTYDWFYKQVASGKQAGYVNGYPDGTFQPNKSISRAEAAVMVAKALGLESNTAGTQVFKDAAKIPSWAAGSVGALAAKGILNGYEDGTFGPTKNITRAEAAVMLNKAKNGSETPVASKGINGTVTLDGKAVSGAAVKAYKAGEQVVAKEVTTDASGKFKLDVAVGTYDVVAVQGKAIAYAKGITVTADQGAQPELKLAQGVEVAGKLLDKNGNALKNTTFTFTTDGVTFTGKTDSSGAYKLTVLSGKTYTVRAVNPDKVSDGLQVISSSVAVGDKDAALADLKATFTVSVGGGGGGGGGTTPSPTVIVSSVSATDVDPLGDKIVKVTFTGAASNVKVNNNDAQQNGNVYSASLDKDEALKSITVNGTNYMTITTGADPLNDTSVKVKLNAAASKVTVNGEEANSMGDNTYGATITGSDMKVTTISVTK